MQAWLQPMHARIVASAPDLALAGISGSQISARVITVASASPRRRISSASCGWLIRPATMTGTETTGLTRAASGAVYPAGYAIDGTMWSEPAVVAEVPATTET